MYLSLNPFLLVQVVDGNVLYKNAMRIIIFYLALYLLVDKLLVAYTLYNCIYPICQGKANVIILGLLHILV
jgi:hypothetical protein